MARSDEPTEEELKAIRAVILSGVAGDFQDVASAVQDKYRLSVSASLVEEVYRQMRDAEKAEAAAMAKATHRPHPLRESAGGEETLHKVLRFAQEMGGFDQARAASFQRLFSSSGSLRKSKSCPSGSSRKWTSF